MKSCAGSAKLSLKIYARLKLNYVNQQCIIKAMEIRGKTTIAIFPETKQIMLQHILCKTDPKDTYIKYIIQQCQTPFYC